MATTEKIKGDLTGISNYIADISSQLWALGNTCELAGICGNNDSCKVGSDTLNGVGLLVKGLHDRLNITLDMIDNVQTTVAASDATE